MDIVKVLQPFYSWLLDYFSISVTVGGYSFTVGALYMWCMLFIIVVGVLKGLAR